MLVFLRKKNTHLRRRDSFILKQVKISFILYQQAIFISSDRDFILAEMRYDNKIRLLAPLDFEAYQKFIIWSIARVQEWWVNRNQIPDNDELEFTHKIIFTFEYVIYYREASLMLFLTFDKCYYVIYILCGFYASFLIFKGQMLIIVVQPLWDVESKLTHYYFGTSTSCERKFYVLLVTGNSWKSCVLY